MAPLCVLIQLGCFLANPYTEEYSICNEGSRLDYYASISISGIDIIITPDGYPITHNTSTRSREGTSLRIARLRYPLVSSRKDT